MNANHRGFAVRPPICRPMARPDWTRFVVYWNFSLRLSALMGIIALVIASAAGATFAGQTDNPVPTLRLGLKQAVDIALAPNGNVRSQLALEMIRQARARSNQARAALLPNLDGAVTGQRQVRNIAASGIQIKTSIPGFSFPKLAGPYNTIDARATLSQSIFNLASIRRFQAARKNLSASEADNESVRDQVAGRVATAYLEAVRAKASVAQNKANAELAEALVQLAVNQKKAGTGTGIEVTRARVQLSNERQRLLAAQNEQRNAYLRLLKIMGIAIDARLTLTEPLTFAPLEEIPIKQAVAVALESRQDLKAQQLRIDSARLNYRAAGAEHIPSLVGYADYGTLGTSLNDTETTWTLGLALRLPIFDGGLRDARRVENLSLLQQEKVRQRDLQKQIELDVRLALDDRQSAYQQVQVADQGVDLAQGELDQARRRYQSGITGSVEVTDAQTRLTRARDNQVAALFSYNLARVKLAQAMGTIRQLIGVDSAIGGTK